MKDLRSAMLIGAVVALITLLEFDQIVEGLLGSEARELEPARRRN